MGNQETRHDSPRCCRDALSKKCQRYTRLDKIRSEVVRKELEILNARGCNPITGTALDGEPGARSIISPLTVWAVSSGYIRPPQGCRNMYLSTTFTKQHLKYKLYILRKINIQKTKQYSIYQEQRKVTGI